MIHFWERDLNLEQLGILSVLSKDERGMPRLKPMSIQEIIQDLREDVSSLGMGTTFVDTQRADYLLSVTSSKGWTTSMVNAKGRFFEITESGNRLLIKVGLLFTQIAPALR